MEADAELRLFLIVTDNALCVYSSVRYEFSGLLVYSPQSLVNETHLYPKRSIHPV